MNNARRDTDWLEYNRPTQAASCPINSPSHYIEGRSYEPIDVIADWELNFNLGNVVKYVSRAGRKGGNSELQDLKKALFYLQRQVDIIEESEVPFDATEAWDEHKEEVWEAERQFFQPAKRDYQGPLYAPHPDLKGKDLNQFIEDEVVVSFLNQDGSITGRTKEFKEVQLKPPTYEDIVDYEDWAPCEFEYDR